MTHQSALLAAKCRHKGITCISPSKHQIDEVATPQDGVSAMIEDITYCYVSPRRYYKPDFNPATNTFGNLSQTSPHSPQTFPRKHSHANSATADATYQETELHCKIKFFGRVNRNYYFCDNQNFTIYYVKRQNSSCSQRANQCRTLVGISLSVNGHVL